MNAALAAWLAEALGDPGPFTLTPLTGGNSNETLLLTSPDGGARVLRRPPAASVNPGAHALAREHRILGALHAVGAPVPEPLALSEDPLVLVMERVVGAVADDLAPTPGVAAPVGFAVVDALAALHSVDHVAAGLGDLGRPAGFVARQPARWRAQRERANVRELPGFDAVVAWLEAHVPPAAPPAVVHGDLRLDNCILAPGTPTRVAAVIDWELATIGDPLMDLGQLLAFWGTDRADPPAMPHRQRLSRAPDAPTRAELAARYAERTGRDVTHLRWYMAMALIKLAAIIEGAYAQHLAGNLDSPYARSLEHDVPALVREAAHHTESSCTRTQRV